MKKYILFILMGFIITYTFFGVDVKSIGEYKCGTSKDVVEYTDDKIREYLKSTYYSSYDITSIRIKENDKYLINSCPNFKQDSLNKTYNARKNFTTKEDKIGGTCSVVAAVSTVMFYDNYDKIYKVDDNGEVDFYCELLDTAIDKKITTRKDGTTNGMINNLLSLAYDLAESNRYGNTEWYHIKKKLNKSLNKGVPEMYSLKDHSVVVCGYTTFTFTVTYEKKKMLKTFEETKEAYIVNDGWGRWNRSIVFKDKVGNIINGHLLTISSKK